LHDKKLKDILPQPLPALLPPALPLPIVQSTSHLVLPLPQNVSIDKSSENPVANILAPLRVLQTPSNSFGLFRRYHAETFPSHDPESELNISTLSDIVDSACFPRPDCSQPFGPFPNKSAFLLGDWYWNRGTQKSQRDFKELLDIIGADDFRPEEIRETRWDKVNQRLGLNNWDGEDWTDDDDARWKTSPITISVPFNRLTENPGPRNYTIANFYHRTLTSIIREKLANPTHSPHFHYEPYELIWQPGKEEVRVHGEMYTSPAFINAHTALQNSPPEPGCDLPRVIVALMFWSDATHLTNFGNAKLWPLYMLFGNESKYRRCKPSCNACEHVAYFETVRLALASKLLCSFYSCQPSFQIRFKTSQGSILERKD
jgi:hypothetical protein